MNHIYKSLFLFFVFLFAIDCHGQEIKAVSGEKSPYTFAVGADPQLFMKQKDDAYWQMTTEKILKIKPDFLIVCGDLTNAANKASEWKNTKKAAEYERQADTYLNGINKLKGIVPVYNVAGNHDVTLRPTPERLAWYEKKFGKAWYSFEHKNSLFVVLESNLLRDSGGAPELAKKQLEWLSKLLKDTAAKAYDHKFAFLHHPLCLKELNEKDSYYNITIKTRKELFTLFKENDFSAIFSGHLHKNNYVSIDDIKMITTAACCAPLGKDPRGFHLVTINSDKMAYEYHPIETKKNE